MDNVFLNGGMIGKELDFRSTEKYAINPDNDPNVVGRARPTLVGQQSYSRAGSTAEINVAFNLTGGSDSAPSTGDIVILVVAIAAEVTTLMTAPTGYTQIANISSNDTYDSVLFAGYKIMGATPDATFTLPSALSTLNAQMAIVSVWRGVDIDNPIDVASTTAIGINGRLANPPPITPISENAIILGIGATAYSGTVYAFSSGGNLAGFISVPGGDTYDGALGLGYYEWVSGEFDPTAFAITGTTFNDSWTAVTLALRPALSRNYKNSGIWGVPVIQKQKTDPHFDNVSLLIRGDNTVIVDSSSNNLIMYTSGTPTIVSSPAKFKQSILFNRSTNSYIYPGSTTNLAFGTLDWTIEMWIYFTYSGQQNIIDFRPVGTTGSNLLIATNSSMQPQFYVGGFRITGAVLAINTWYHFAISKVSGQTRMFVNGTQTGVTFADSVSYTVGTSRPRIGNGGYYSGSDAPFGGYIDELRITRGVGRYATNFDIPTTSYSSLTSWQLKNLII